MKSIKSLVLSISLAVVALGLAFVALGLAFVALPSVNAESLFARTSVRGLWGLSPETIALTGTQTFTPTNSRYLLAPATTLTMTLATGGAVNGDVAIFVNTVATDTIFVDTGAMPGGAKTLDEDADRISFEFDGAEWLMADFTDQSNAGGVGGAGSFTTLSTTGNTDVGGTLQYGADNNFPLGFATSGSEIVCATSAVFTGSTEIDVTALTTATYVLATQVTAPITTASHLHVSDPTTTTITLTSLNNTFAAGTTGVSAHYCVVGDQ